LEEKVKYVTVSIPKAVADRIDYYLGNLGYWPSRSSFVREAVLEKFSKESRRIVDRGPVGAGSLVEEKRKVAAAVSVEGSA
jgi:Arc/MetJ-type ribon-helix-helix transcriptional regulator